MAPEEFFFLGPSPDQYLREYPNNNFRFQNLAYRAKPLPILVLLSINRVPLLLSDFLSKFLMYYPHPKDTDLKPSCPYHKSQTASYNHRPARTLWPALKAGRTKGAGALRQAHQNELKQCLLKFQITNSK